MQVGDFLSQVAWQQWFAAKLLANAFFCNRA
jgi:hypothetical protein